jgi:FkbM family methyltransferase
MNGIFTAGGSLQIDEGGNLVIAAPPGTSGYLQFGPYIPFEPGAYTLRWRVVIDPVGLDPAARTLPCCQVDVTSELGVVFIVKEQFSADDILRGGGMVSLPFQNLLTRELEFRFFTTGILGLKLDPLREVVRPDGSIAFRDADVLADFSPVLEKGTKVTDAFFLQNVDIFQAMYGWGVRFTTTRSGTIGHASDIFFFVRNQEDKQIVDQCFVLNQYDFDVQGDASVIDIGMNVGLASLFMAKLPNVREVHSFEPFKVPFDRAIENISLNPTIGDKINPHNIGLSDGNQMSTVGYADHPTDGASTRGVPGAPPRTIEVRDAAEMLGPVIARAEAHGWKIVVKIDCERAEFAIYESLAKAGLLEKIDLILMGWRTEWDAAKTRDTLIKPLLAREFVVLDRTQVRDPHVRFMMAVRTGRALPASSVPAVQPA